MEHEYTSFLDVIHFLKKGYSYLKQKYLLVNKAYPYELKLSYPLLNVITTFMKKLCICQGLIQELNEIKFNAISRIFLPYIKCNI